MPVAEKKRWLIRCGRTSVPVPVVYSSVQATTNRPSPVEATAGLVCCPSARELPTLRATEKPPEVFSLATPMLRPPLPSASSSQAITVFPASSIAASGRRFEPATPELTVLTCTSW